LPWAVGSVMNGETCQRDLAQYDILEVPSFA
jgi:hypothetical protein